MLTLRLDPGRPLRVAAIGAHCDDVEIGCGGLLLDLAGRGALERLAALVVTSDQQRAVETEQCLRGMCSPVIPALSFGGLPDGRLPGRWDDVKDLLQQFARDNAGADVVLAPSPHDAHQDHRLLGEMTRTVFRDHVVLHYEIPKWDGDLGSGRPQTYWPLTGALVERKWGLLDEHHVSQRGHDWWRADTFAGLSRLRGMECRADHAEAFHCPSIILGPPTG